MPRFSRLISASARHLRSCAWLAQQLGNWRGHLSHADYLADLRKRHGREAGFWSRFDNDRAS